jgi:hypothetical protein
MNGYLVVLRHEMDDLPVGLFATQKEAAKCAANLDEMPTTFIRDFYQTDCSTPCSVAIVKFSDGEPWQFETVRDFEKEERARRARKVGFDSHP